MDAKTGVTHSPRPFGLGGFQFMRSLCGAASVSSALSLELVTCKKCLEIKAAHEKELRFLQSARTES